MKFPKHVIVTEVGPRDGFQIESMVIPTAQKVEIIDGLAHAGVSRIETTSCVRPDLVPQMADAEQVLAGVRRQLGVTYIALCLNSQGADRALASGVDGLSFALSASETHNRRNAHASVEESLHQFERVSQHVHDFNIMQHANVKIIAYVGTAFGCPYEGAISEDRVVSIIERYLERGADEVSLADTTGMANPRQVARLVESVLTRWPDVPLGLHFHNTRGMGLANVLAGLEAGVIRFDASIGGLGGCPFAPGATGNICTEDLVHMLEEMGIATGIDLDTLIALARQVQNIVGHELSGHIVKAGKRSRRYPI